MNIKPLPIDIDPIPEPIEPIEPIDPVIIPPDDNANWVELTQYPSEVMSDTRKYVCDVPGTGLWCKKVTNNQSTQPVLFTEPDTLLEIHLKNGVEVYTITGGKF